MTNSDGVMDQRKIQQVLSANWTTVRREYTVKLISIGTLECFSFEFYSKQTLAILIVVVAKCVS